MRKDPTEGDRATVKSRLRYLLAETGKTPNWVESESQRLSAEKGWKPLSRGEVWRMANGTRGIRPGGDKLEIISAVLGASYDFLARGKGAPFSHSDPPMRRMQQDMADMKHAMEELRARLAEPIPALPAARAGHIRPSTGHIRPKR